MASSWSDFTTISVSSDLVDSVNSVAYSTNLELIFANTTQDAENVADGFGDFSVNDSASNTSAIITDSCTASNFNPELHGRETKPAVAAATPVSD